MNSKIDTILDVFSEALGSVLEAKLAPKSIKKSIRTRLAGWIDFLMNIWVGAAVQELLVGGGTL